MPDDKYSLEIEEGYVLTMPQEIIEKLKLYPGQRIEVGVEAGLIVLTPSIIDSTDNN